jgi:CheY-like chemotaxis protein
MCFTSIRYLTSLAWVVVLSAAISAQEIDFRPFMKRPETPMEFWEAMRFEIEIGKYDLAADRLKGLLKALKEVQDDKGEEEANNALLQIEAKYGMSGFLRLLVIPETRADAKPLVERMGQVLQKHLSDSARIQKFVRNLSATPEERLFALRELRRSGASAVPHLVNAVTGTGNTEQQAAVLSILPHLYKNSVPPLVAALDSDHVVLKLGIIEALMKRGAVEAAPHLWYLYASPAQPPEVQRKAAEALQFLLESAPGKLISAKAALVREAERYLQHRVRFDNPDQVTVWQWDGKELGFEVMPADKAEEYFGLRFARQALDLDPGYEPAQLVFVTLALDRAYQDVDQPLSKAAPRVKEMLATINPDLLVTALQRALNERRLPVILGTIRALGDLVEVRAARPRGQGMPVLARALYYPDRRVQFAAADALLRIPGAQDSQASARVVAVLGRLCGADSVQKVLIADFDRDRAEMVAQLVKETGYEPVAVQTGREAMYRLRQAADIDCILIDQAIPDPEITYLLSQLRADADLGLLPVFILVQADREGGLPSPLEEVRLRRLAERYPHVWTMSAPNPAQIRRELPARIREALGRPLSDDERKNQASQSILWLAKMAAGELPGYDVGPVEPAVRRLLRSDDEALASRAIEIMGRLRGPGPQRELAAAVLDANRPAAQRARAAEELVRNLQVQGQLLLPPQVAALQALAQSVGEPELKATLPLVVGALRPDPRQTGETLKKFAPVPVPAEREKER